MLRSHRSEATARSVPERISRLLILALRAFACSHSPRLGLAEALEPVLGDGLPRRRIGDERAPARPDAGIAIESAESHAHLRGVIGIAAEEVRSALPAEQLLVSSLWMAPSRHQLLALYELQGAPVDPCLRRARGAGPPLAASAMTVTSGQRGSPQGKANAAAQTASAQHALGHKRKSGTVHGHRTPKRPMR